MRDVCYCNRIAKKGHAQLYQRVALQFLILSPLHEKELTIVDPHGKTLHVENASQSGQPVVIACVFLSNDVLDGCNRVRV